MVRIENKKKEVILSYIKQTIGGMTPTISMITNTTPGGHRFARFVLKGYNNAYKYSVEYNRQNSYNGLAVEIGIDVMVENYPTLALNQFKVNDEPWYGCPHHYQLSEDRKEVLYVRHGTNACGETGNYYPDERYKTFHMTQSFKFDELKKIEWLSKPYYGYYTESPLRLIQICANASKEMYS